MHLSCDNPVKKNLSDITLALLPGRKIKQAYVLRFHAMLMLRVVKNPTEGVCGSCSAPEFSMMDLGVRSFGPDASCLLDKSIKHA